MSIVLAAFRSRAEMRWEPVRLPDYCGRAPTRHPPKVWRGLALQFVRGDDPRSTVCIRMVQMRPVAERKISTRQSGEKVEILALSDRLFPRLHALRDRQDGQALVEYALIIALVSLVAIAGLSAITTSFNNLLQNIISVI
jgi:Flp pilus assembly pilin Flp